jgi:urea carboxylase
MLEVIEGGIQTTVQEYPGRVGYLNLGTYPAGPMDHFAFRIANLLAGNAPGTCALEVTLGGLKARFNERRVVSVTGAAMQPTLNGSSVPMWQSFEVKPGDLLALGMVKAAGGFRSYLAVSGGFDVPEYMGSRATFTVGGFGGFQGRGLKKADRVPLNPASAGNKLAGRRLRKELIPSYAAEWEIEVMRGPQADPDYLTAEDMDLFFSKAWKVDRNSNRMGIRLESHKWQWARATGGVAGGHPSNILDNGYAVWTVNICGDQPIILVADGPSLGGFICNATLVHASTWKAGQLVPGRDLVRFKEVTIEEAISLARRLDASVSERSIEREY